MGLNYLVLTRQQRPWVLLVLGCGLPGATAAAADLGKQVQALIFHLRLREHSSVGLLPTRENQGNRSHEFLGHVFQPRLQEAQSLDAAASLGEQSLHVAGVLCPTSHTGFRELSSWHCCWGN
jgi:hypothetical protein